MVSEVGDRVYRYRFMLDKSADDKLDISTDTAISMRISLCHSGFKGLAVSSVRGIVTFNN